METSPSPENGPIPRSFWIFPRLVQQNRIAKILQYGPGRERDPYCPEAPSSDRLCNRRHKTIVKPGVCLNFSLAILSSHLLKMVSFPEARNNKSKCIVHRQANQVSPSTQTTVSRIRSCKIHIPMTTTETNLINN